MSYIDAHVHVWTPDVTHYPLAPGCRKEDMKPASFTPEELFAHCRPAGVERINLIQMIFYGFDNRYMLEMISRHKSAFVGTAVIDPHGKDVAHQMADLATKRVRAFRIYPALSKVPSARWLEPAGYAAMFAAGARHNQAMSCLVGPDDLPEIDRMCGKFPDTPVIIDHLCRIGANGTIADKDVHNLCALAEHPRMLVKVGAFYALGKKQPPYLDLAPLIQRVVHAFGARRCMWESDCPFQVVEHKYRDSIDLIRNRLDFLTATDKDWLLQRTAEEFFFKK
jgi:predicted TIM-barrel fold metal-dependent hydrolase